MKKITFLLLHLGYGGIETSTINTVNALCDKYKVEIISLYKLKNNQEEKINKKVDIKYLYDGEPNKKDFLESVKNKRIISIFMEGLKSLKILFLKKYLIIKAIKTCKSDFVISTRLDFSILLSRFGNQGSIKIAQEHRHHNNERKYINNIKYKLKNIDYLFALTNSLKKDYTRFFSTNNVNTKVVLVPNMLTYFPNSKSTLNKKNIISVGRLHEGKRICDLVQIFSKIDNKVNKLYIIGDGEEYQKIKDLINKLKLNDRIKMTGFLNQKEIQNYLLDSSLFAMTSVTEGLPMVLLEAMSNGLPCIAYETDSGILDIIDDKKNGYVIKNRNEQDYIYKINELLTDEKKLRYFSKNAIEKANEFNKDNILNIWYSILDK